MRATGRARGQSRRDRCGFPHLFQTKRSDKDNNIPASKRAKVPYVVTLSDAMVSQTPDPLTVTGAAALMWILSH
jgi:hypothetical protein